MERETPATVIKIARSESLKPIYHVVPSLLSPLEPFIDDLIQNLKEYTKIEFLGDRAQTVEQIILDIIRDSLKADFVFVMQSLGEDDSEWRLKSQSSLREESVDLSSYVETIKTQILDRIALESIFAKGRRGIYANTFDKTEEIEKASIVFPLNLSNEFLAICNSSSDRELWNDAHGRVISTFYQESLKLSLDCDRVEAAILDRLKQTYGFVPLSLYDRRLELFKDRLKEMVVYFEPILDLKIIKIWGWEALARDPQSQSAPVDLFQAAELWGRTFTLQLDIHFLQVAIDSYYQALEKRQNNRIHERRPLSINVYPDSLMQDEYFEAVRERVEDNLRVVCSSDICRIPSDLLILEISEKAKLPEYQKGIRLENPLNSFYKRLTQYTHDFDIKFSIDDFGVGHASVSRLAGLNTPFVKIDREILHHKTAEVIFDFINDIVKEATPMNPAKVIVEGLDKESPISLKKLNELKIRYVQGYVIGKAKPEIYYFDEEKIAELRNQILEEGR
ncbi:MAG: EAL domain-containing protein [Cyanobacteria bacterium SBLK]|nr:EAL domain-containing protein [Cyanobacteria bacterium SBLK]